MQARKRHAYVFTAVAAVLVATVAAALAQSPNPHVGTWKLNIAKSTYSPGPAPKSSTTKIEAAGAGVKYTVDQVSGDGTVRHWEFTTNYDGKDSKVTGNNPDADMVAVTRVNPNSVQIVSKLAGKVTTTLSSVVAADGKTRMNTTKGTNAKGQTVNNVALFEKQ
jgi:hypothetical protein